MTEPGPVGMLALDAIQRSVDQALGRLKAEVPSADIGGARVRFNQTGATVTIYTRFRLRHMDGEVGAAIERTWRGDITPEGYIALRW